MVNNAAARKFVAAAVTKPLSGLETSNYGGWIMDATILAGMHRKLKRRFVCWRIVFIEGLFEIKLHCSGGIICIWP
jgi:hypothetical protein